MAECCYAKCRFPYCRVESQPYTHILDVAKINLAGANTLAYVGPL
jgi:hypothetical protein